MKVGHHGGGHDGLASEGPVVDHAQGQRRHVQVLFGEFLGTRKLVRFVALFLELNEKESNGGRVFTWHLVGRFRKYYLPCNCKTYIYSILM